MKVYSPPRVNEKALQDQKSSDPQKKFDEAVALVANLHYDEAAKEFAGLADSFEAAGDRTHAGESLFWLAYCYEKTGRTSQASGLYSLVAKEYAATPAARQARQRMSPPQTAPEP